MKLNFQNYITIDHWLDSFYSFWCRFEKNKTYNSLKQNAKLWMKAGICFPTYSMWKMKCQHIMHKSSTNWHPGMLFRYEIPKVFKTRLAASYYRGKLIPNRLSTEAYCTNKYIMFNIATCLLVGHVEYIQYIFFVHWKKTTIFFF